MTVCKECGQCLPTRDDPVEHLKRICLERGIWVSYDDRVRLEGAAELLGVKMKTLNNWRYELRDDPPWEKRNGRPLYSLAGIAAWLNA